MTRVTVRALLCLVSAADEPTGLRFTPVDGIDFVHFMGDAKMDTIIESAAGGVTVLDFDGDGLLDLYFTNGAHLPGISGGDPPPAPPRNRLYRNRGDWKFEAVDGAGDPGYSFGAAAGDYDNDGDPDLYVCNFGRNTLYRNDGGRFTDVTAAAGVGDERWSIAAAFADLDGDGLLDLYVANYLLYDPAIKPEQPSYPFPSPLAYKGQADRIYRNLGDGRFADVTEGSGVGDPDLHSMGLAVADLDADGLPDVFVSGDGMANALYRNLGGMRFEEVSAKWGVRMLADGSAGASMGAEVCDLDEDGLLDLLVPDFGPGAVYLADRPGLFRDRAASSGIGQACDGLITWSGLVFDADHDGHVDCFFTNASAFKLEGQADRIVRGAGGGRYRDVSGASGPYFLEQLPSRGAAAADLDGDGDLDLVVAVLGGRARLLRNDAAGGHWLQVRLRGTTSNRDGLGARVEWEAGGLRQVRVLTPTSGYGSQNPAVAHFGLGESTAGTLHVLWPRGARQSVRVDAVDRVLEVVEPADE